MAEQGDRAVARERYTRGQQLYAAGDYQAALVEFQAAYTAAPHPTVLKSQAECQEQLGNTRGAVELLERYLRDLPTATDRADVEGRIAALRARPGTVRIVSNPPGATITLDGARHEQVTPAAVSLSPGDHAAAIEIEGYQMVLREFRVEYGTEQTVDVEMIPIGGVAPPPPGGEGGGGVEPPPPIEGDEPGVRVSTPVWIMTGLAGAGLITGIITGSLALADQGDFDDGIANDRPREELEDLQSSGEAKALVADIAFGVAAAAAITGVILFFVDNARDNDEPSVAVTPMVGRDGGGVGATIRF